MAMKSHTIRHKDGGDITIENYNRPLAVRAFCTECLGFEGNSSKDCTSPMCPLYPFRGKINHSTVRTSSE